MRRPARRFHGALLAWVLLALVACKGNAPPPAPLPTPVVTDGGLASAPARTTSVRVDRRVELVSIICRLAQFPEYVTSGSVYLDAIDRSFAPFRDHAAVTMFRTLRKQHGISYDAPMILAVHLDDTLALQNAGELAEIDARWKNVDAAPVAAAIKAFATDSKLDAFLAEHAAYHASLVKRLEDLLAKEKPVEWFDSVFGPAGATFVAIPSAIAKTNNYGVRATSSSGARTFYQLIGAGGMLGMLPPDEALVGLLVHEMAHSYINPVFTKHEAELSTSGSKVFSLVEKHMRAQAYGNWLTMVHESGVRAVVVNYMREKHGDAAGARQARSEHRNYFLWINELAEVMRLLAKERAANPSYDLEKHMPQIVAFFDRLAESYSNGLPPIPFRGPVNAVHRGNVVWVLPANTQVASYARMIHTQLKMTAPIVTASATTVREQRGKDLVVYGTPADNPVVDYVARSARWKIEKDSIVLGDKKFSGPGLVLIACWYVRDSPSNGVVLYAAPDAASLVGINNVRHGPNDWLVARKQGAAFAILGAGDFPRAFDDLWMLPGETSTAPPTPDAPTK